MSAVKFRIAASVVTAAMAGLGAVAVSAAAEIPKPVDILFEKKHLELTGQGDEVTYRFERTVSDPKLAGEPFSDDIKIDVIKAADNGQRDLVLKVFTGDRARDAFSSPDMTGNPILLWYLDRCIGSFRLVAGGNYAYLKGRFREALRDKATIEPAKIDFNGKSVDGYRITVTPYVGDPNAEKMKGYDGSKFVIVVSDAVPGYFLEMLATYENSFKQSARFNERISLVGTGAAK